MARQTQLKTPSPPTQIPFYLFSSLRTTAHLMAWIDDYYQQIEGAFGHDVAASVAASQAAAIDWVEDTCRGAGGRSTPIDAAGFTRLTGYLVPAEPSHNATLDKEAAACTRLGVQGGAG